MGQIAVAVKHLMAAGVGGDELVRAIEEMEQAVPQPVDEAAERRRAKDRERKRAARAAAKEKKSADNPQMSADSKDIPSPPYSPPSSSPTPPPTTPPISPPSSEFAVANSSSAALPADPIDEVTEAFDAYQRVAKRLKAEHGGEVVWPIVAKFNTKRRSALKARLREYGLEAWGTVLRKAAASDHCLGGNDRGWVASFDFLTSPSGFVKTLEGNYDNRTGKEHGQRASDRTAGTANGLSAFGRFRRRFNEDPPRTDPELWEAPREVEGEFVDVTAHAPAGVAG